MQILVHNLDEFCRFEPRCFFSVYVLITYSRLNHEACAFCGEYHLFEAMRFYVLLEQNV